MPTDYLQFIRSVRETDPTEFSPVRFLVSGMDPKVREIVGQNIIMSSYSRGNALFILDNTHSGAALGSSLGRYHVLNALDGNVGLCGDLFSISSPQKISRLRALLAKLGFDGARAMKIVSYLSFVEETERRLGNTGALTIETLEQYGGTMPVEWKLDQLAAAGSLTEQNRRYLLGRYAEIAPTAADFESFLILLTPFAGNVVPSPDMAVVFPMAEFGADLPMQAVACDLLLSYIRLNAGRATLLILDEGNGERNYIVNVLKGLPASADAHMLSSDVFSLGDADLSAVINLFPVRIYTRHEDMSSCAKIERQCGEIDVVKRSSAVAIDRRRTNSVWDMLMGTDRTDTAVTNAPVRDPRFRKEYIQAFPSGVGIVDYAGNKALLSF